MVSFGTVWWNELRTPDENGASEFYTKLMGWQTFTVGDAGNGGSAYTVWMSGWSQVGGMLPAGQSQTSEGFAGWVPFFAVEDVDNSARRAEELGGSVLEGPFDVPNSGRFALLRDPQGVVFGIARPLAAVV